MCDPITLMMMAQGAMSGMQMIAAKKEANKAEARAVQQAEDEKIAANQQLEADYAEQRRQISDTQSEAFEGKSDAIRAANKALGTLRATETALSDSSLGSLMFEEAYGNALNYARLSKSTDKKIDALESNKNAAQQSFLNRTTLADNNLENTLAETSARKKSATLNFAASTIQMGTSAYAHKQTINAIKGTGG